MRCWYSAATAPRPFPAGCGSRWAGRSPSISPSRCGPSRRGSRAPCTTRTAACSAAASSPNSRHLRPLPSPQPPRRDRVPRHGRIASVPGTLQSVPGAPARQRRAFTRRSRMPAGHRFLLRYIAVAAALLAAACGDNPLEPKKPSDPLATAANVQALGTSFTSLPFQSFSFATTYVPTAASPMAALRPLLRAAQPTLVTRRALSLAESRLAATALRAALVPPSGAIAASIFPPGVVLGTTYTWNATTFQYEANDPAVVPGAPSNGVRFILYALDLAGQPIATQPIGYADLMDESSGNTQTLHVLVVGTTTDPPVTYLDYAVSVTLGAGTATAAVVGFITDGIERLDFNAAIGETSGSATFDIRFDVNAADAHVRLRMTLTAPDQNTLRLAINFRLQFGSEVVTVTGTQTLDLTTLSESATLTVLVDGGIYATITETDGSNTFAGGGGQELTADDLTALRAIFDAIATTVQQFDALFAPAGSLGA